MFGKKRITKKADHIMRTAYILICIVNIILIFLINRFLHFIHIMGHHGIGCYMTHPNH